jgi:hypothetical protein
MILNEKRIEAGYKGCVTYEMTLRESGKFIGIVYYKDGYWFTPKKEHCKYLQRKDCIVGMCSEHESTDTIESVCAYVPKRKRVEVEIGWFGVKKQVLINEVNQRSKSFGNVPLCR